MSTSMKVMFPCLFAIWLDLESGRLHLELNLLLPTVLCHTVKTHFSPDSQQSIKLARTEANKAIRKNATSQKQKVLIGDTLRKSRISLNGNTPEIFSSRVDAAKQLGRLRCYADEKRRLLSIVAMDYPYSVLQKYFQCSSKTVTAAKVHCILFGRGGVPVEKFKFTRQCVSPQVLEELTEFLHRDDVSRASSCRSVLVDGEETAVRYWQDTVKGLINQYLLEFPNGVKRTYIYTHLPTNFRMNTMLAGLCNICDDFGHSNFDELCTFIEELCSHSPGRNGSALVKDVRRYQTFVKTKFSKLSQRHSSCLEVKVMHFHLVPRSTKKYVLTFHLFIMFTALFWSQLMVSQINL